MKTKPFLLTLIVVLTAVLALLMYFALRPKAPEPTLQGPSTEGTTLPSTQPTTDPTTEPSTEPTTEPSTEPPTEPSTEPPTVPTISGDTSEMIGSLYTRGQLEAMENNGQGYGPGTTSGGKRPPYADPLQQEYGQYAANFIAPDNGKVYLTFDCGYEYTATDASGNKYRVTAKILDVLKEKNVKAVFFITMDYAKDQPDLVQRMIDEGHAVGNHSTTHPVMPDCTIDKMVYEITTLHAYVKEHFGYEMTLFRFPTGEFSTRSLAVVQTLGYKSVHWSFAYGDYDTSKQPAIETAYNRVTGSHHSGAIYLLHAISTTNATILPDVIDFLQAEGYSIELFQ